MTLSNLVKLRLALVNTLQSDVNAIAPMILLRDKFTAFLTELPELSSKDKTYITGLVDHYNRIIDLIEKPIKELPSRLWILDNKISELSQQIFSNNYDIENYYGTIDEHRNLRKLVYSNTIKNLIQSKIFLYTDWKYPALEIGCCDGDWTQFMIAADPLYITDRYPEFLEITSSKFNSAYQNRLRKYELKNHNLSIFPYNQFSFIFSWDYFTFISMDTMKVYLKQIFQLLRPGGVFMCNYNDGDTVNGAANAEMFYQTYMPKSILISMIESMGFETIATIDGDKDINVSWIEIKKPGILHTIKSHQVLGKILPQDN